MVKIQRSSMLFFDRYQWCGRFYVPECGALRGLDHRWIDRIIAERRRWGRRSISHPVGSWKDVWRPMEITARMVDDLHQLCDFFLEDQTPHRLRIQEDVLSVYCGDAGMLDRLKNLGKFAHLDTTQIQLHGRPGTVNLKSSSYALRSYLRRRRLSHENAKSLRVYLLAQQDVRLSPSLQSWCSRANTDLMAHYFFDHDHAGTVQMLELIWPGLVKCSLPITTDK